MGHRCGGPNCYRTRGLRSQCPSCNRSRENRRKTIIAGGKVRRITPHLREGMRKESRREVTLARVAYVLDNWAIRGVHIEHQTLNYLAFVPDISKVIRVAVSPDDKAINSAYADRTATKHWKQGNLTYFANQLADMEQRNEPAS